MSEERFGEFVAVRRDGGGGAGDVAGLVPDPPKALKAVSTAMARSIARARAALGADRDVRVVVLTSTHERAFCVGADLKERNSFTDADLVRQRPLARAAYTGGLELPVPTIAAVHGFALGGGFELALSCDLIVGDRTPAGGMPAGTAGGVPRGGWADVRPRRAGAARRRRPGWLRGGGGGGEGPTLRARGVGAARAAELMFSARRVEAEEAHRLGSWISWWMRGRTGRRRWRWRGGSRRTRLWGCGRRSGRCGSGRGWTCGPG